MGFDNTARASAPGPSGLRTGPVGTDAQAVVRRNALAKVPDHFVEMLKSRADVIAVVGRRVELKKAGASMVGLCPFHNEKSPSFHVSANKQMYHCFGCGASGDSLQFLLEYEGMSFREAVRALAQDLSIALPPELDPSGGGAPAVDLTPLYAAMMQAQTLFAQCLKKTDLARDYLRGRGFEPRIAKRYCIGFAPNDWRGLKEVFPDYESNAALRDAGLIRDKDVEKPGGSTQATRYDYFRNRVTFGVRDARGRIIAFGARSIDGSAPKYLNSPETLLFEKSNTLFGLYEARDAIRACKEVVVVEGYTDVIMAAQHGMENVVSCMGTAFTRLHIERLLSASKSIVFCFDGDAAGQKAALRAVSLCAEVIEDAHDFRFLMLPDGQDPDEFLRAHGKKAFDGLSLKAPGFTEFLISTLQREHGFTKREDGTMAASAEARARFAAAASDIVNRIGFRVRLRRIALDQIDREAREPGSAMASIATSQHRRPKARANQWAYLLKALQVAPGTGLEVREDLLALLDESHEDEAELAHALQAIPADAVDNTAAPGHLSHQSALRKSFDQICEFRRREIHKELDRRYGRGEIDEADYIQQRTALARGELGGAEASLSTAESSPRESEVPVASAAEAPHTPDSPEPSDSIWAGRAASHAPQTSVTVPPGRSQDRGPEGDDVGAGGFSTVRSVSAADDDDIPWLSDDPGLSEADFADAGSPWR